MGGASGVQVLTEYTARVREGLKSVGPGAVVDRERDVSLDELLQFGPRMGHSHLIQTFKAYDWTCENVQLLSSILQKPMVSACQDGQIVSFSWAKYSCDATGLTAFVTLYAACTDAVGVLSHL